MVFFFFISEDIWYIFEVSKTFPKIIDRKYVGDYRFWTAIFAVPSKLFLQVALYRVCLNSYEYDK